MKNISRGKRAAITGLAIFLAFMALCTIITKGIYTSGMPLVSIIYPSTTSLSHELRVTGTVRQGLEYGIYTEPGLRVGIVAVRNGDSIAAGEPLFQIDPEDIKNVLRDRELTLSKLASQQRENSQTARRAQQDSQETAERAEQDYNLAVREADGVIQKKQRELDAAREELALYQSYLSASSDSVSSGDTLQQYERQERLEQLRQTVLACESSLSEAERARDNSIIAAERQWEDARDNAQNTAQSGISSGAASLSLDIAYQQEELKRLQELLAADGWVYAEEAGRVLEVRVSVGSRTQDTASILYAKDSEERIVEVTFSQEDAQHLAEGAILHMEALREDGKHLEQDVHLRYMEDRNGRIYGEISVGGQELRIGQTVSLEYRWQSDIYDICVNKEVMYEDDREITHVYVVEERDGVMGTEWIVRRVNVSLLDENETMAAISGVGIGRETRIVRTVMGDLEEGKVVRVVE